MVKAVSIFLLLAVLPLFFQGSQNSFAQVNNANNLDFIITNKYNHLSPFTPNTVYLPGTIIAVNEEGSFPESTLICTQEQVLGEGFEPIVSNAEDLSGGVFQLPENLKKDIDDMTKLLSKSDLHYLNDVKVSFQDAKIVKIAEEDDYTKIEEANFAEECALAVEERLKNDDKLTIIRSAIETDMTYVLDVKSELRGDEDAQKELAETVALIIADGSVEVTPNLIKGENFYWGVVSDNALFEFLAKKMCPSCF